MANTTNLLRQKQMFRIVEQWKQGAESKQIVCNNHNITVCKFDYWLKKYRSSKRTTDFIEIKPTKKVDKKEQTVKFYFSGDVLAEVPSSLAIDFMNQLIVR